MDEKIDEDRIRRKSYYKTGLLIILLLLILLLLSTFSASQKSRKKRGRKISDWKTITQRTGSYWPSQI